MDNSRKNVGEAETSVVCKVPGSLTFGRLSMIEYTVAPSAVSSIGRGRTSDQIVYVIDGVFEFLLSGKPGVVGRSETLMIPRGSDYEYRNVLGTTARFLLIETPCGDGRFFDQSVSGTGDGYPPAAYGSGNE